jgi:very-short-patch-repair endonuclease
MECRKAGRRALLGTSGAPLKKLGGITMKKSAGESALAFQLRAHKIPFEAEYRFAPPRKFRFDFAFPDKKIACEIDGGIFTFGRHSRPAGIVKDMEKFNIAAGLGYRILKFTPQQVKKGEAILLIAQALGIKI